MKEIESAAHAANGRPSATNGAAAQAEVVPLAVSRTTPTPAVASVSASTVRSRFGPAGTFAKRIIERLMRFYTRRQDAVNAGLAERMMQLEAEIPAIASVRRDLVDAALDFGAIADRMRDFENVRRVVERSGPFRSEVRNHRRELAELRQHVAALSARLTLIQRESAPVRAAIHGVHGDIDALREVCQGYEAAVAEAEHRIARLQTNIEQVRAATARDFAQRSTELPTIVEACERLAERVDEAEASIEGTSERLTALARDAEGNEAAIAEAEHRIARLQTNIEQVRAATARDFAQRSTELRTIVEEIERRLSATAEHLAGLVKKRADANELAFEELRSEFMANHEESRTGLERRIERAQRMAATLRTAFDVFQRESTANEEERFGAIQSRFADIAGAIESRYADIAGALNVIHDAAGAEQAPPTPDESKTPEPPSAPNGPRHRTKVRRHE